MATRWLAQKLMHTNVGQTREKRLCSSMQHLTCTDGNSNALSWHGIVVLCLALTPSLRGLSRTMVVRVALLEGGTSSPRTEIPVDIAACGTKDQSIVDGPQAAMIVGDMKVRVCGT